MASNSIVKTDESNDNIKIAAATVTRPIIRQTVGGKEILFSTFDAFMERYNNRFLDNSLDEDAQAWIDLIQAQGVTVAEADKQAINTCVIGLKEIDYWNDIYSMGLFWFGNEAANSVRAKIGGNITFPGGTRNHNIDYLRFSGNGYANLGFTPTGAGMLHGSNGVMAAMPAALTNIEAMDIGSGDWAASTIALFMSAFGSNFYDGGAEGTARLHSPPIVTGKGLYAGNRLNADAQIRGYDSTGPLTIATSADRSSSEGTFTSLPNLFLAARNNNGVQYPSNRSYMFWLIQNKGVSEAKLESAMEIIYTMLATRGLGTTINSPVTNLAITDATDNGTGTHFDLTATWTNPTANCYGRVRVTVNDLTVYEEDIDLTSETITLAGLAGVPSDAVDIYIAVLGETEKSGPSSDWVTDGDVVADDMDIDALAYIARANAAGPDLTSEEQQLYNDLFIAGKANAWYSRWYELWTLVHGNAAKNALGLKNNADKTFNVSYCTHNIGHVTFTPPSDYSFASSFNHSVTNAGMSENGVSLAEYLVSGSVTAFDMCANNGGIQDITLNTYAAPFCRLGAGADSIFGGIATNNEMYVANRYGVSDAELVKGTSVLGTKSSGFNTFTATGTLEGPGNSGSLSVTRSISFFATGIGMTPTIRAYFVADVLAFLSGYPGAT